MGTEIWKDIQGYEGLYKISNNGNIKSLKHKGDFILKNRVSKNGRLYVVLYKINKIQISVHRLVASAFLGLDIYDSKSCVCHKDDNPGNNNVENLFLGSHLDNMNDMKYKGRDKWFKKGRTAYNKKSVIMIDVDNNKTKFESVYEANIKTGIDRASIIMCCKVKRKTAGGYKWKYFNN